MKKIEKTIKITFTYTTLAMILVALFVGYSVGNFFPITARAVETTTTTTPTSPGTSGSPSPTGGTVQISDPFGDDPVIGSKNAPVVMIEFSDFQCPFCRRFYTQSLSQLESEYVSAGKVAFVYKDFPLDSIHPGATPWALAAQCAHEQNKWREMHNKIFDEQQKLGDGTVPYPGDSVTKQWASEIGLNTAQFDSCFDSKKYQSEIQADFNEGVQLGVGGTPTFYIGNSQKGFTQVVGAQPYTVLKSAIDSYLS